MKTVKVILDNGADSFVTRINGSEEEIKKYYMGNWFNMGTVSDKMMKVTGLTFLQEE